MLEQFLQDHRVPTREGGTHQHVRHGWLGLNCPWCLSYKWHLGVRLSDGYSSCWRCGPKRLGDVLMTLTGLSWPEVKPVVLSTCRYTLQVRPERTTPDELKIPPGIGELQKPHKAYLHSRGFDPDELAQVWGVQGIGVSDWGLSWRLYIPIVLQNHVVSWVARSLSDEGRRWKMANDEDAILPRNQLLYGIDKCGGPAVVIHEGPTDVWATGPGSVGVLGLKFSQTQIAELIDFPVKVICFDRGKDAQKRADQLARELRCGPGEVHVVELETGDDPASADGEEIQDLRERYLIGNPLL